MSAFLDTNLDGHRECRISTQTLSEFANVALKKLQLEIGIVNEYIDVFQTIGTILPDANMVKRALQIKQRYDIQFYDSMMVAAAERAGCEEILSEDLSDGQSYFGVTAHNPFRDAS